MSKLDYFGKHKKIKMSPAGFEFGHTKGNKNFTIFSNAEVTTTIADNNRTFSGYSKRDSKVTVTNLSFSLTESEPTIHCYSSMVTLGNRLSR